jgi:hypothetical protein
MGAGYGLCFFIFHKCFKLTRTRGDTNNELRRSVTVVTVSRRDRNYSLLITAIAAFIDWRV